MREHDDENSEWDRRGVQLTIAFVGVMVILLVVMFALPRLVGGVVEPKAAGGPRDLQNVWLVGVRR